MRKVRVMLKSMMIVLATITTCMFDSGTSQSIFAKGNVETESVTGTVFQFGKKGKYDLSSADESYSTESGTIIDGQFSVTGSINSVSEKDGLPSYSVSEGTLTFSYTCDDELYEASEDETHLVSDKSDKVDGNTLDSDIRMGALLVQTSKDGEIWFDVPGQTYTNIFKDNPEGLEDFYTTTDVQMVNGCYYRVLVVYETGIRTQKAKAIPPTLEKYEYTKYAEEYCFYAYDENAIDITVPDSKNRMNLGSKVRTKSEGYAGSGEMDNDDPHFGWDIGQFFVGGFTEYENDKDGNPVFLKNNGDRLSLWFELQQDIDKCYGNKAIRVIADTKGSDAYFEVPGGVNETTDFGRGTLIVRKTNPDKTMEEPQIYTNYLEASASTDAVTKVDLFEEGDYEVALDYSVKFDKTKILGKSVLPKTSKYRIFFKFSVRNGNSMVFLFDKETGSELSSGSITENGFRIDYANSKYLKVNVKREVLKDGFDGLTEDTRFNSWAADGDEFTSEGVYTITVTNRELEKVEPTVKRIYVGKDNILKAYMVNNIPISEIKEMLASGAIIADDGTISEPESEDVIETSTKEIIEIPESDAESEGSEESESRSMEETVEESSSQDEAEIKTESVSETTNEEREEKSRFPIIPIAAVTVIFAVAGCWAKCRKKSSKE